jgi:hypothetical protein
MGNRRCFGGVADERSWKGKTMLGSHPQLADNGLKSQANHVDINCFALRRPYETYYPFVRFDP